MKKIIAGTLLSLFVCTAQAQETSVLQLFACNFKEGKTVENLWDVADRIRNLNTGPAADEAADFWQTQRLTSSIPRLMRATRHPSSYP